MASISCKTSVSGKTNKTNKNGKKAIMMMTEEEMEEEEIRQMEEAHDAEFDYLDTQISRNNKLKNGSDKSVSKKTAIESNNGEEEPEQISAKDLYQLKQLKIQEKNKKKAEEKNRLAEKKNEIKEKEEDQKVLHANSQPVEYDDWEDLL